jgi:flagellin
LGVIDEDIGLGHSKGTNTFYNALTDATKSDFQDNMRNNILSALDTVLLAIADDISDVGAYQNRLESAINVALDTKINLTSASSRIRDADHAQEIASLAQSQMRFDAGKAAMMQAKNLSKETLSSILEQI